jgi:hypothetical protein
MNFYEIYPGGVRNGELVIETPKEPNEHGIILLSESEYDASFSRVGRDARGRSDYHEEYDVTTFGDVVALHPEEISNNDLRRILGYDRK